MNYRHAYHAGNFADVVKHAILALVVEHAKQKPGAFRVLDTHAGLGRYDLEAVEAGKTGEWRSGIGRLLGQDAAPLPVAMEALLAPYLDVVRTENASGALRFYPGSVLITRRLLRLQDRLIATELHPDDFAILDRRFARDSQTKVLELDGWLAIKSFLPPKERRGIVLIDPPYEEKNEFEQLVVGLEAGLRRFQSGIYLLWYPIKEAGKDGASSGRFHEALRQLSIAKIMSAEILVRPQTNVATNALTGTGMIIVNPPWTLWNALEILLPFLAKRLAVGTIGKSNLQWL